MAKFVKSVSGNSTTYTVSDLLGNSMALVVTQTPGYDVTTSYSGGPILQDAAQMLTQLMIQVSTGLLP